MPDRPAIRSAPPRELALAILRARYGSAPESDPGARPGFELADFQAEAVARAREVLRRRRGVIVADGVGLGKTYIGLALVEECLRGGGRACAIAPAALAPDWQRGLGRLARRTGSGSLGIAGAGSAESRTSLVAWVSHARLSRGTHRPERLLPLDLVVVDEAHAFRTPTTRRYRALAELCRGSRVVLLTATPVNNTVWDLYHLLRLFAGNGSFRDVGVADLEAVFRRSGDAASGSDPELLAVLRETVIRRTRSFVRRYHLGALLRDAAGRPLEFPDRAPPRPVRYALGGGHGGWLAELLAAIESLTFAPYRLADYGARAAGDGLAAAELLRLGLVRRLESSVAALGRSVVRQLRFHEGFVAALARGHLVSPRSRKTLFVPPGDDDSVQLVLEEMVLDRATELLQRRRLLDDARADLERLRWLHARLRTAGAADPKLAALRALLDGELAGRRVVVFTEFRDTARHLWRALLPKGGVALVDGGGAFAGAVPSTRRAVIRRFAPMANGARPPPPRERVDVLIATDVLAEGLNLQDCDTVVSYDLPWNPVRLIQRIGRVDRPRPGPATVHAYHFLPEDGLEEILGILGRLCRKLAAISGSVGADHPVLGVAEESGPDPRLLVDRIARADPDAWRLMDEAESGLFGTEDRLYAAYRAAEREHGREAEPRSDAVPVAVLAAGSGDAAAALVACRVGGAVACVIVDGKGRARRDEAAAAELIVRALAVDVRFPAVDGREAELAAGAALRHLELERLDLGGMAAAPLPARSSHGTVAVRAARALMQGLARSARPDRALCARVDRLLERLAAAAHGAGTEHELRAVVRKKTSLPDLVTALELALGGEASATAAPDPTPPSAGVIAVLVVRV